MTEGIYGKLTLLQEGEAEHEFELSKTSVSFGRGAANDIVLNDARVSRSHARLDCSPSGVVLTDLGSSNGCWVNGQRVERAVLKPGDLITLGGAQLHFDQAPPFEERGLTIIDNEADLDLTIDREVLPIHINETRHPHLVVMTGEKTWEAPLVEVEVLTIGRSDENDVPLAGARVSRRHAEIRRKGELFILRDLGSTNGTWQGDEKLEEVVLHDNFSFRIGSAQLLFKLGHNQEALTLAGETLARAPRRRPVVFVPGLMGSQLWLGSERVWPNVRYLFRNPEIFRYPSSHPLEPRGIVDEVVIVPNLIKQDQYNRLGDYLVEELGYERGYDFFEFAYDWRQDVRLSARQLGQLVDSIPSSEPITIIAHSLGTMVTRYYVDRLGGLRRVGRVILMGGPHQGVVKALTSLLVAPSMLPFGIMGERLRGILLTFSSSYQILPTYACAKDQHGQKIHFLEDESWLAPEQVPLLRAAREFRRELGRGCSVPALSIFGYGQKTVSSVQVRRGPQGELVEVQYRSDLNGDNTILEKSAVLSSREIHPVRQHHGSLFVDNDVKMRLKVELARQFSA